MDINLEMERPCVATIGFFDGVHRGHRCLIDQVKAVARAKGLVSALVTFPEHPAGIIRPQVAPELLTTLDEKIELLDATGVNTCLLLDFTPDLSRLSAYEFMREVLKARYRVKCLVVGHDHRFGCNRSEMIEDYRRYGEAIGMDVVQAQPLIGQGQPEVSSSIIRGHLYEGRVDVAASMLGYHYFLQGAVVHGFHKGREIGFPTANLQVNAPDRLIPANGVYAVYVIVRGRQYAGMLNIGRRPTFGDGACRSIEVHLLRFNREIYGEPIRIGFVQFIRPEVRYDSVEALVAQLHRDAETVKNLLL